MVTLLRLVFWLLLSNKHLRLPLPGAAIMVTAYGSCFYDQMDPSLLCFSDFYSLPLCAFYTSISSCFSQVLWGKEERREEVRQSERKRGVWIRFINHNPEWKHEAPCWLKFSRAADSWNTRQNPNGCLGSADGLGLINLWQGLWYHIAKSMMTFLLLINHLELWAGSTMESFSGGQEGRRTSTCLVQFKVHEV